ncbi:MAG: hypothetical protein J0L92_21405 [Deltaproteobacteria bacterium]|nr:hypothetical protein [Deltaproteobacteria bacterium]
MTSVDFDALALSAYPSERQGPRAAMDALWRAAFALPEWYFAVHADAPALPFAMTLAGQRFVFAFTDRERVLRFAATNADVGALAKDLWIAMPVRGARAYLASLVKEGVFGVHLNHGQPGWFAPLAGIETIFEHLRIPPERVEPERVAPQRAEPDPSELPDPARVVSSLHAWPHTPARPPRERPRYVPGHLADFPRRPFEPKYTMPDDVRAQLLADLARGFPLAWFSDRDYFGDMTSLGEEDGRRIYRTRDLAYLLVTHDGRAVTGGELVEGDRARDRNAHHAFLLTDAWIERIERLLPVGANVLDAIPRVFGPNAREAPLVSETTLPDGTKERMHRVVDGGLVILRVFANDRIGAVELLEGGAAFRRVMSAKR